MTDQLSYSGASATYVDYSAPASAASGPLLTSVVSSSTLTPSSSMLTPSSSGSMATPIAVPYPNPNSGLSVGAKAAIGEGVIIAVLCIILLCCWCCYGQDPPPAPPRQPTRHTTPQPTGMATIQQESPPFSPQSLNFTMPSNAPVIPPTLDELSPDDSASNIGGPRGIFSQARPPDVSSEVHAYPTSHSALGALLQSSVQRGRQPVVSPGTEFGSMPPHHAPDVNPGYTFSMNGPQQ